jgi:hypothetical protein
MTAFRSRLVLVVAITAALCSTAEGFVGSFLPTSKDVLTLRASGRKGRPLRGTIIARPAREDGQNGDTPAGENQAYTDPQKQAIEETARLQESLDAVAGGLREEIARLTDYNATSVLRRMNAVPSDAEARSRRTSTFFLVEELTTDDGLTLSGDQLLEARSNWVRDLLSTGNSLLLRRIADRLGFVGVWAIAVSLFFTLSPADWMIPERIEVPAWPHELIGGFLSILLVFRTDQAYERFWQGRSMWSDVAGHVRSMAMVAVTVLDGEVRDVILAHLCAFPITLKQHLRGMRSGQEIYSVFEALGVRQSRRARGVPQIVGSNNMPLTLLTSLSSQLRGANSMGTMTRDDLALFKGEPETLTLNPKP